VSKKTTEKNSKLTRFLQLLLLKEGHTKKIIFNINKIGNSFKIGTNSSWNFRVKEKD
jgi:hypothetical protein